MSQFTFTDPKTGHQYSIKAPAGVTFAQAEAIFKQQLGTGALVGYKVGETLSSVSQAAKKLLAAVPNANQTAAQLTNKLLPNTNLNTINFVTGPGGAAAAVQTQVSAIGQSFPASTNVSVPDRPALSAADLAAGRAQTRALLAQYNLDSVVTNGTAGGRTGSFIEVDGRRVLELPDGRRVDVPGASTVQSSQAGVIKTGESLFGVSSAVGSLATNAVASITSALRRPVVNGINTADLVKQGSETALPDLSATNVQAAMAQAAKLSNQTATQITNKGGVGKYGLSIEQLEKAGYVKAGTTASLASSSLTQILASPTVWTGKDGVKDLTNVLTNSTLQDTIQKDLMSSGLTDLKTLGVPVDKLTPQAIAGLANNAAKSVENTIINFTAGPVNPATFAIGGTVPGAQDLFSIGGGVGDVNFDEIMRDSAWSVDYAEEKVSMEIFGEVTAEPAEDTVDTATLDAAGDRIIGNEKVPDVVSDIP